MARKRTTPFETVEEELKEIERDLGPLDREKVFYYAQDHQAISCIWNTFPTPEAGWREACLQVCDRHIRHFRVVTYDDSGEAKKLNIRSILWEKETGAYAPKDEILADPLRALQQELYVAQRMLGPYNQTPLKRLAPVAALLKKTIKVIEKLIARRKR